MATRKLLIILLLVILGLGEKGFSWYKTSPEPSNSQPKGIIVKFKNAQGIRSFSADSEIAKIERIFKKKSLTLQSLNSAEDEFSKIYKLTLKNEATLQKTLEKFEKDPQVEYAEPNYTFTIASIPRDS